MMTNPPPNKATVLWARLLRFGFRLLYNEMAFTYDLVADTVSMGQWWAWGRTALPFLPPPENGRLLELAHGTGRLHLDLIRAGYQVSACDLSPYMGRIAARRLQKAALPQRLVRAQAQTLPFPSATFAAAVSTFPTPFIIDPATLHELRRVLRPDGVLVVVPNGVLTGGSPADEILERAYQVTGQRGGWPLDLAGRFAECGFSFESYTAQLARSITTVWLARPR